MIERVIENWLINASEKAFQVPFCQVLIHQGYTVVHLTRHCPTEMGKDIIAIAPDGTPTAFQLKAPGTGKVTLNMWRKDLVPQVNQLVEQAISHASMNIPKIHRPVLVVNGELAEEASQSINQYNTALGLRGIPENGQLRVIVRGQLQKMFLDLGENLIPSELKDEKSLLELYLMNGDETFPKNKFADILESLLPLANTKAKPPEQARSITAASVVTALALAPFSKRSNHVACFEAWTLYCSYILCLAEKRRLAKKYWEPAFLLGLEAILESLERLSEELTSSRGYVVGDPIADVPFYRIRITHLVGLMALLGLWSKDRGRDCESEVRFVREHLTTMSLWGEYAVPQFLASYFFLSQVDANLKSVILLKNVLEGIAKLGNNEREWLLPGPEVNPEEFVLDTCIRSKNERHHVYHRGSFAIEGLLHLYVRQNWKQSMKMLWPEISRVHQKSFRPSDDTDYYRWYVENGHDHSHHPQPSQSWAVLREEAEEHGGDSLPELLKKYPIFYLAFLLVCPHRFSSSGIRWLDSILQKLGNVD